VARDAESARLLREAASGGDEIGAHLHAWETPPEGPGDGTARPYIYEYEPGLRLAKLRALTETLTEVFGAPPVSYRAGRWGLDALELRHLASLGYHVDTSIVPGHDFSRSVGRSRSGPDFRRYLTGGLVHPWRDEGIWEVPASATTIGTVGGTGVGAALARACWRRSDPLRRGVEAFCRKAGLCDLVWVRPLAHPRAALAAAAAALVARGAPVLNVMFHSSEAFEGTSPKSRTALEVDRFYGDLEAIVLAARAAGPVEARTLREVAGT
jgi:peptidoglycan/xylan/chitin deacetylase (PgdA/CDA1 family)